MTRRLLFSFAVFLLGLPAAAASADPAQRPVVFRTQTMGTWATLTIVTADSASVADLAYRSLVALHGVDSLMSNWTTTSEVARINREAAAAPVTVQPEVAGVLDFAMEVSRQSGGAFDITVEPLVRLWGFLQGTPHVPEPAEIDKAMERVGFDKVNYDAATRVIEFTREGVRIDFGGIAKGYGVDRSAEILRAGGAQNALIDLSGNMVAIGDAAVHDGWTVGIRDPSGGRTSYVARLHLFDEAVATSGDYEQFVDADGRRYGHILDPRTGYSASGLRSVTVVSSNAMACDAWATAFFVLGPQRARSLAQERDDLSVILIEDTPDGPDTIWVEETLRDRFELLPALKGRRTVRYF